MLRLVVFRQSCFPAHTDIRVPLPHTDTLVSLGFTVGLMGTCDLRELCSLWTAEPNDPPRSLLFDVCCYCMTAGWGAIEVYWMLRPGASSVLHCQPAARGLLSLISLLRAFLLNAIKRNRSLACTRSW